MGQEVGHAVFKPSPLWQNTMQEEQEAFVLIIFLIIYFFPMQYYILKAIGYLCKQEITLPFWVLRESYVN